MSEDKAHRSLTTRELADRWKLSEATVKRRLADREIPSFKVGHLRRIPMSAVEAIERGKK